MKSFVFWFKFHWSLILRVHSVNIITQHWFRYWLSVSTSNVYMLIPASLCEKYWWLSSRLLYLQCISTGDTAVLHKAMAVMPYAMFCNKHSLKSKPRLWDTGKVCLLHWGCRLTGHFELCLLTCTGPQLHGHILNFLIYKLCYTLPCLVMLYTSYLG